MSNLREFINTGTKSAAYDYISENAHDMKKDELATICKELLYAISDDDFDTSLDALEDYCYD